MAEYGMTEISEELLNKIQKCHVQSTEAQGKLRDLYTKLMNKICSTNQISCDSERALNKILDNFEKAQRDIIEQIPN